MTTDETEEEIPKSLIKKWNKQLKKDISNKDCDEKGKTKLYGISE